MSKPNRCQSSGKYRLSDEREKIMKVRGKMGKKRSIMELENRTNANLTKAKTNTKQCQKNSAIEEGILIGSISILYR